MDRVHEGMSDSDLLEKCQQKIRKRGFAPWLYWTSEIYSLGKTYRFKFGFSKLLPLIFYSDHGVGLEEWLFDHEIHNKARYHLTFSRLKFESLREFSPKKVLLVEHPYLYYKKVMGFKPRNNRKGTICFIPHTVPSEGKQFDFNFELYLKVLDNLDDKYKPFVLSLQMHDVTIENLRKIRKYNIPIISAGNTLNSDFVDNLYNNISNFMYATSPEIGTHTWICQDFGIDFFILGNSSLQDKYREIYKSYQFLESIFSIENVNNAQVKEKYLDIYLGRNNNSVEDWIYPTSEYLFDFLKMLPEILKSYPTTVIGGFKHLLKVMKSLT